MSRLVAVLAAVTVVAAGCSGDDPGPVVIGPEPVATEEPAYDASLEPSAAVLAIVPETAAVLEVTDFRQVRLLLGYGDLTSESAQEDRRRFWRQARAEAALLSTGMLRDEGYDQRFGFTQDDVLYEAHFDGPAGEGYVVKFRDDLDMRAVQRAAAATDGPLADAVVVVSEQLAAVGATSDPTRSWAADPALVELVGQTAAATYVSRDCVSADEAFGPGVTDVLAPTPAADVASLAPLGPFSVAFGGTLVTVRLGGVRTDVFERARLAERLPRTDPEFEVGYADPVGDPQGGRIGFSLGSGPVAATLAHQRRLPFALCGG